MDLKLVAVMVGLILPVGAFIGFVASLYVKDKAGEVADKRFLEQIDLAIYRATERYDLRYVRLADCEDSGGKLCGVDEQIARLRGFRHLHNNWFHILASALNRILERSPDPELNRIKVELPKEL